MQQISYTEKVICVKHHLPKPNDLLNLDITTSQRPISLCGIVFDNQSQFSTNCKLSQPTKQINSKIITQSYGNNINNLLNYKHKIVFLTGLANQIQNNGKIKDVGVINTSNISKSATKSQTFLTNSELEFSDDFQCSNIYLGLRHQKQIYLIANRLDFNTYSYGQWFYFKVKNITNTQKLFTFIIVNMTKSSSMFGKGLKVSVCRNNIWAKEGISINYSENSFKRQTKNSFYRSLSFSLNLKSNEEVYCAYNQPYTYTRLGKFLDRNFLNLSPSFNYFKRNTVCRSYLNNRIDILSFTMPNDMKNKKVIVIMGRSHPIQTAGSFVMEGIIEQFFKFPLRRQLMELLENFVIKIIPMINPDGVIVGNSRCNIHGYDLNRRWNDPQLIKTPQIFHILKAILKIKEKVSMLIDLHAHSKKKNVFAYGCHDLQNPFASRQFPFILSQVNKSDFVFSECRFSRPRQKTDKDGTARLTLYKKLKIHNIFTIENSYCSAEGSLYHYDESSYKMIGKSILEALGLYFNDPVEQNTSQKSRQYLIQQLKKNKQYIQIGLRSSQQSQSERQQHILEKQQSKEQIKGEFKEVRLKKVKSSIKVNIGNNKLLNYANKQSSKLNSKSGLKNYKDSSLQQITIHPRQFISEPQAIVFKFNKVHKKLIDRSISNSIIRNHNDRYLLPIKKLNNPYQSKTYKRYRISQPKQDNEEYIQRVVNELKITQHKNQQKMNQQLSIIQLGQTLNHYKINAPLKSKNHGIFKRQIQLKYPEQDAFINNVVQLSKNHYHIKQNPLIKKIKNQLYQFQ